MSDFTKATIREYKRQFGLEHMTDAEAVKFVLAMRKQGKNTAQPKERRGKLRLVKG